MPTRKVGGLLACAYDSIRIRNTLASRYATITGTYGGIENCHVALVSFIVVLFSSSRSHNRSFGFAIP